MNNYSEIVGSILSQNFSEKTIGFLIKNLKKNLIFFRNNYKKIVLSMPKTQLEQNLYNNYYIIEKIAKILLKENKNYTISISNNVPVLGQLILNSCVDGNIPETNKLVSIIKECQSKKYITNTELELIIWSFRYAIISELFNVYSNNNNDSEIAFHLIMLLAKSDTFDLMA